ncbi:MAG TPA: cytochrome c [Verrucomicrobiae bacterium]|nr:cytochrome c [Verrucomicrobiae bacterium]
MRRFIPALVAVALTACAPTRYLTNAEIPSAKDLKSVMWAQAQLTDPAFKKINAPAYSDADWAAFLAIGERLQLTTAKIKGDFSKGQHWNELADSLAGQAGELTAAAQSKNVKAASEALGAMRASCRACHADFR